MPASERKGDVLSLGRVQYVLILGDGELVNDASLPIVDGDLVDGHGGRVAPAPAVGPGRRLELARRRCAAASRGGEAAGAGAGAGRKGAAVAVERGGGSEGQ